VSEGKAGAAARRPVIFAGDDFSGAAVSFLD